MSTLRPAGSGATAQAVSFLRATATPKAALVVRIDGPRPADWPTVVGIDATDANVGHSPGWGCEVRNDDLVLLNPLGEGFSKSTLPPLDDAWLHDVRTNASVAVYLLTADSAADGAGHELSEASVSEAGARGPIVAASIRASIADSFGQIAEVGRNEPCPCGSERKYKHCHGS